MFIKKVDYDESMNRLIRHNKALFDALKEQNEENEKLTDLVNNLTVENVLLAAENERLSKQIALLVGEYA